MPAKKYEVVKCLSQKDAVGMAVTCHPRTDPYVRNYRIRLLPWVLTPKRVMG